MASALVVEIGVTVLALGVLVYFLAGFLGGVVEVAVVLVIGGIGLLVLGFAIGGRRDDGR